MDIRVANRKSQCQENLASPKSVLNCQLIDYRPNLLGIPSQPPGIVVRVFSPPQAHK
jgi:hypothetical protein